MPGSNAGSILTPTISPEANTAVSKKVAVYVVSSIKLSTRLTVATGVAWICCWFVTPLCSENAVVVDPPVPVP